jgi:general secretion pathway protein J
MPCKPNAASARGARGARRTRSGKGQNGLTLVELLVAIGILAIVAVMGWRGLDTIVRARVALTADLDNTRGLQLAFAQLQNDCTQIASPTLLQGRQPLRIDQGRLSLVRTVQTEANPLRVQVVSYQVRDGVLLRQESPATRDLTEIDTAMQSAVSGNSTGTPVALQGNVASISLRLWSSDNRGWRMAQEQQQTEAASMGSSKAQIIAQSTGTPLVVQSWTGLELTLLLTSSGNPLAPARGGGGHRALADHACHHHCRQPVLATAGAGALD